MRDDEILVHACCGPCSTASIERLLREGWKPTIFYSNSNIVPFSEFEKRWEQLQIVCARYQVPLFREEPDHDAWRKAVKGLESEAEGGRRCETCWRYNLNRTALMAQKRGFRHFTTTLTVSRFKNSKKIFLVGGQFPLFETIDFKKQNGFAESCRIAKEMGLYRQQYCGCEFSLASARAYQLSHGMDASGLPAYKEDEMKIKVVAFDMGGVMVRSFDTFGPLVAQYQLDEAQKKLLYGMLNEMCRGYWSEEELWERFSAQSGVKVEVPQGGLLLRGFTPRLDQETVDLVGTLKKAGYRVICATNTLSLHYEWHVAHNQYAMFDKVYASHLMHEVKPEAGFYQAVVKQEGIQPGEMFFCDDNQVNVEGARLCGLQAEHYEDARQIAAVLHRLGLTC